MFTLKVLFLCMTASVVFCEYEDQKSNERDSSTLDICFMEGNMSLGEFQNMLTRAHGSYVLPIPIIQVEKCFLDCIMRKTNMMKNGKISVELLTRSAAKFYARSTSNPKLIYKRVEDIINACLKKGTYLRQTIS
uniref:Odorant-binding protein 7 n=1 Tax=Neotoxoptera formosana TaxID=1425443 RepID=A0AA51NYI7_9HEMI|nr:odorant-binding protein 7 [Neotoxoptera formosana]